MKRPNIVLIVMDTVRADHLSCYGYYQNTSLNIDRLSEQGVLFENAFSAGEWSPPPSLPFPPESILFGPEGFQKDKEIVGRLQASGYI